MNNEERYSSSDSHTGAFRSAGLHAQARQDTGCPALTALLGLIWFAVFDAERYRTVRRAEIANETIKVHTTTKE